MSSPAKELKLMLGKRIDAIVAGECNIHFEGVLPDKPSEDWEFTITSEVGRHLSDRWSFTPVETQIGIHPLTLSYRDPRSRKRVSASCQVHVHGSAPGGAGFRWLAIGDSITHASLYLEAAVARAKEIGTTLETQRTRHGVRDSVVKHEGYPGWKFGDFLNRDSSPHANFQEQTVSAFSFGNGRHFDFRRYLDICLGGKEPDFVTIFLGTNDIALLDDKTRSEGIDGAIRYAEVLVTAIIRSTENARVGLISPLTPASQDAFGINYGCLIPRWLYRKNQRSLVQAIQVKFTGFHERVSCIPAHQSIDPHFGYPLEWEKADAGSDQRRLIHANALHPSLSGHQQIGGTILAWMMGQRAAERGRTYLRDNLY